MTSNGRGLRESLRSHAGDAQASTTLPLQSAAGALGTPRAWPSGSMFGCAPMIILGLTVTASGERQHEVHWRLERVDLGGLRQGGRLHPSLFHTAEIGFGVHWEGAETRPKLTRAHAGLGAAHALRFPPRSAPLSGRFESTDATYVYGLTEVELDPMASLAVKAVVGGVDPPFLGAGARLSIGPPDGRTEIEAERLPWLGQYTLRFVQAFFPHLPFVAELRAFEDSSSGSSTYGFGFALGVDVQVDRSFVARIRIGHQVLDRSRGGLLLSGSGTALVD